MSIDELKKEYRSVHAPRTAMPEAVGRFEIRHTRGNPSGISLPAWSLAVMIVLGVVIVPKLMEQSPQAVPIAELSLTALTMPVGPAMPSLTGLSTPSGVEFSIPQLRQITLLPTKETI